MKFVLKNYGFPLALSYDDVLLVPKYSDIDSRSEVDLTTKITKNLTLKLPLISINMDSVTGVAMAIAMGKLGGMGMLPRFDSPEVQTDNVSQVKNANVIVAAAIGCKNGFMERAEMLIKAGAKVITLDVAHGHMKQALEATSKLKNLAGDEVDIISGVVATYEGARDLFKAGADSVRIGLGPGTICTTRVVTGFGVPQITAVLEGVRAAREFKKTIISDGGAINSGDIVKVLACGAVAHIAGSIFAGTEEAPGEKVEIEGKMYKEYNASTSRKEKIKHLQKNGSDKTDSYTKHVEGIEALVPYKGPVSGVVEKIAHGLRSGFSYAGARNITELWEKAEFMRVTNAGMSESHPHGVISLESHLKEVN